MVPPATLALRDRRPRSRILRSAILLASAGELAADKYPKTPSRTEPAGLAGRFTSSAAVGLTCAGRLGGLFAGATAIGSAFATHRVRVQLGERTGVPDPVLGAAEDAVAILIARTLTRRPLERPPVVAAPADAPPPGAPELKGAKARRAAKLAAKAAKAQAVRSARRRVRRPRRRRCRLCRRSRR
jgi:hypothetical protein